IETRGISEESRLGSGMRRFTDFGRRILLRTLRPRDKSPENPCQIAAEENQGAPDDPQVELPGCVLHVVDVVANPFLEVLPLLARAANLPEPGNSGACRETRLSPAWR